MPRELRTWRGKAPPPERRVAASPTAPRDDSAQPAPRPSDADTARVAQNAGHTAGENAAPSTPCPSCGRQRLRTLASGALGCLACGSVFSLQEESPVQEAGPNEEDVGALDTMDAINEMLRSNQLALGPGGVPLAEPRSQAAPQPARGRGRNRRRVRR